MSMSVLAREHTVEPEVGKLRAELGDLQSAIASLTDTLGETAEAKRVAEEELAAHRAMLAEAADLRVALEHRLHEVEVELRGTRRALGHQRMISGIRARLLAEIAQSRPWARGRALRRAAKVERLLGP